MKRISPLVALFLICSAAHAVVVVPHISIPAHISMPPHVNPPIVRAPAPIVVPTRPTPPIPRAIEPAPPRPVIIAPHVTVQPSCKKEDKHCKK